MMRDAGVMLPRSRPQKGSRPVWVAPTGDRERVQEGRFLHGRVYQTLVPFPPEKYSRDCSAALALLPKRAARAMDSSRVAWLSGGVSMLSLDEILQHFHAVKRVGQQYQALCPAHDDHNPSLSIREGDHAILFTCQSRHCAVADIIGSASPPLTWSDILPDSNGQPKEVIYTATFSDEEGVPLYESLRFHPKSFALRAASGEWKMEGIRRVLYRLADLKGEHTICLVEGPQKADALWRRGIPATCIVGGALGWAKWSKEYLAQFHWAGITRVACFPDNDPPGESLTIQQVHDLCASNFETQIIRLPNLPPKGDVLDFLAAGGTTAQILALLAETPPVDTPPITLSSSLAFDAAAVEDASVVIAEGLHIAEVGITWTVQDLIPSYGMLGMHVAATKVGKTTLAQALAADVAMGRPFLERPTVRTKVFIIAAEDPAEYTAFLARHLQVDPDWLKFYRRALILDDATLNAVGQYIRAQHIGFVLSASWQAVVRTLIRDENDHIADARTMEQDNAITRFADAVGPHFPSTPRTTLRRQITAALTDQPGVKVTITKQTRQIRTLYSRADVELPNSEEVPT